MTREAPARVSAPPALGENVRAPFAGTPGNASGLGPTARIGADRRAERPRATFGRIKPRFIGFRCEPASCASFGSSIARQPPANDSIPHPILATMALFASLDGIPSRRAPFPVITRWMCRLMRTSAHSDGTQAHRRRNFPDDAGFDFHDSVDTASSAGQPREKTGAVATVAMIPQRDEATASARHHMASACARRRIALPSGAIRQRSPVCPTFSSPFVAERK